MTTPPSAIRAGTWQHVAVVVRRGRNDTRLYVNGSLAGEAATGSAQFDDTKADLRIGHMAGDDVFQGDFADVRLYAGRSKRLKFAGWCSPGSNWYSLHAAATKIAT